MITLLLALRRALGPKVRKPERAPPAPPKYDRDVAMRQIAHDTITADSINVNAITANHLRPPLRLHLHTEGRYVLASAGLVTPADVEHVALLRWTCCPVHHDGTTGPEVVIQVPAAVALGAHR